MVSVTLIGITRTRDDVGLLGQLARNEQWPFSGIALGVTVGPR